MKVENKKLPQDEFGNERKTLIAAWPTGDELDFEEAVAFHKSLPANQNYARVYAEAKKNGLVLLRSDCGIPLLEEQAEYLRYLKDEGCSDLFGVIIDSYTRHQRYEKAGELLLENERTGKWTMNGFPIVNHGARKSRLLIQTVKAPVQVRGVATDWRLILENSLAAGFSATSGDPVNSFTTFSTDTTFDTVTHYHQYMWRLMSMYEDAGVPMLAEISGGVGVLTPFSLTLAGRVIGAIIAAEQGIKHMSFTLHVQGNLAQDVAACMIIPQVCEEYLEKLGYKGVSLNVLTTSWSGKFPDNSSEAYALICEGVLASILGGVQLAHVKTIGEASTIPTKEQNAASLRAGKKIIDMFRDQRCLLDETLVKTEMEQQKAEARAILNKVLELGDGDVVVGARTAYELGKLDQVFPTSQHVAGKVLGIRDSHGAVRYLDHGNLPFTNDIIEFNRSRIAERAKKSGKIGYDIVIKDLFALSKGTLVS